MKRKDKEVVVQRLHEKFQSASVAVLSDFSGMTVAEVQEVKSAVRKAKGEFKVIKNRLAIRAAQGTVLEKVTAHFKGPVAVTIGSGDPVLPVKAMNTLFGQQKKLKMKVSVVENRVVDLAAFKQIAKLPSKEILLGQLVVRMKSPLYGLRGALGGILSKFARTLQAVVEAKEKNN
ncbi:MAG: 50S ribosomal protein L10 [Nitrospirota bacterium]